MGKKSKAERDNIWDNISTANFELGWKIWSQYLDKHPTSLTHKLSNTLIREMGKKWESQSVEARNKLYSILDEKGSWKKLPDIRVQSKDQAIDYLRRVQGFDVVLGKPLRNWSQDR